MTVSYKVGWVGDLTGWVLVRGGWKMGGWGRRLLVAFVFVSAVGAEGRIERKYIQSAEEYEIIQVGERCI